MENILGKVLGFQNFKSLLGDLFSRVYDMN